MSFNYRNLREKLGGAILMEKDDNGRCIFPLTNLQIGDLQSYLSHLSLFLAPESRKLFILVDNRPWLKDLASKPTHLWQLMVTKSRLSPFANTRGRKERKMTGDLLEAPNSSTSTTGKTWKFKRWFSLINTVTQSQKRAMLPVKKLRNSLIANSKLHRTLYGFIVFEVSWSDVRGINYLNELQTDTSLAVEAKVMRRWEFDSITQAVKCISSWFQGTMSEQILLNDYLDAASGEIFHDARESFPRTTKADIDGSIGCIRFAGDESPCSSSSSFSVYPATTDNITTELHTPPPPDGPYKLRKLMKSIFFYTKYKIYSEEADAENVEMFSPTSHESDHEEINGSNIYRDVLILLRFNDHDLPFKLKEIIMSDLRLLTLLESGLPSWVLFLQSYPVFCHLYRPWMCPLARAFYVLISIVTVLIGFYDLYKNVPLLKATASHLFGPLFDWIETWEMISRIKYLGTMLFFHNFQKAFKWFLMVMRAIRSCLSVFTEPMTGPFSEFLDLFLPIWSVFVELVESTFSVIWMVVESSFTMVGDIIEILLLPIWYLVVALWNVATSIIYPIFWILGEILYAPFRLVLGFCGLLTMICTCMYEVVGDIWLFVCSIFQFSRGVESTVRGVESTVSSYEVSMFRSLWNDLFSQIFRALRSILNGLVAFFTACNRHRLSIYNHSMEFIEKVSRASKRTRFEERIRNKWTTQAQSAQTTPRGWKATHPKMKYK